jgi:hypothetical protein
MSDSKFSGICMLLAAVILGGAIIYHARTTAHQTEEKPQIGRYQFHPSTPPGVLWILDTTTGEVKSRSG